MVHELSWKSVGPGNVLEVLSSRNCFRSLVVQNLCYESGDPENVQEVLWSRNCPGSLVVQEMCWKSGDLGSVLEVWWCRNCIDSLVVKEMSSVSRPNDPGWHLVSQCLFFSVTRKNEWSGQILTSLIMQATTPKLCLLRTLSPCLTFHGIPRPPILHTPL